MSHNAEGPEDGRTLCLEEHEALMASPQDVQQRRRRLLLVAKASTIILAAAGLALVAGHGVTEGVARLTSGLFNKEPMPDEDTGAVPAVADGAVQLHLKALHLNSRRRRKSWHTKDLGLCKGDCNWELHRIGDKYTSRDNCPGELKCFRWGVPPGCKGKTYPGVAWCFKDHHTVLMIVSKKRSRTDLEVLFSHDKIPRAVDMIAASQKPLSWHLWKALTVEKSAERSALTAHGRRRVGQYKHVVIQEYTRIPVYTADRRRHAGYLWKKSKKTIKKLDHMIRSRGGRTVLFQTWASIDGWEQEMPHIIKNHKTYARMLTRRRRVHYKPLIAPVGHAYDLFKKHRPHDFLKLWEKDKKHESELARYYTALVLYETIGGKSCIGLPGPVDTHLSHHDTHFLQGLAHQAVVDTKKDGWR